MQRQAITQDGQSFLPPEGSLPVETRGRVLGILRRCPATPNDCFLGARAGYGGAESSVPQPLALVPKIEGTLEDTLEDALSLDVQEKTWKPSRPGPGTELMPAAHGPLEVSVHR